MMSNGDNLVSKLKGKKIPLQIAYDMEDQEHFMCLNVVLLLGDVHAQ